MMTIKLVVTDIDGVWTDGGMYYGSDGTEFKKFNTGDSAGVLMLQSQDIPLAIVTGEDTEMVKRRAEKLKIKHLYMGARNKLLIVKDLCYSLNIHLDEVAYIGDDIVDVPLLKAVGLSATPANAPDYVRAVAKWHLHKKGGDGAFREFAEKMMKEMGVLDAFLEQFYASITNAPESNQ